jgi:hypothetical protein
MEMFFIPWQVLLCHNHLAQNHCSDKVRLLCELLRLRADSNTLKTACDMLLRPVVQRDFAGFSLSRGIAQETYFWPAVRTARPRSRSRNFGVGLDLKIFQ